MKELIFYISYKTCSSASGTFNSRYFQYNNSVRLLTLTVMIHILQVNAIVLKDNSKPLIKPSQLQVVLFVICSFLVIKFMYYFFPKSLLNMAVDKYENHIISKYAKVLAVTYILLNILVFALILF